MLDCFDNRFCIVLLTLNIIVAKMKKLKKKRARAYAISHPSLTWFWFLVTNFGTIIARWDIIYIPL